MPTPGLEEYSMDRVDLRLPFAAIARTAGLAHRRQEVGAGDTVAA